MGNLSLLFFTFFLILSSTSINCLEELDYYAFIVPHKNLVLCSEKNTLNSTLILNEVEIENGYSCLIGIKKRNTLKINLVIKSVDNEGIFRYKQNSNFNYLEVNIGKFNLISKLVMSSTDAKFNYTKHFYVKYNQGKIFYCSSENSMNCHFVDSLVLDRFIKLNFNFTLKKEKTEEIVLLEKEATSTIRILHLAKFKTSDDCDPNCVHGVCNEGECYCQSNWTGTSCNERLEPKEPRLEVSMFIIYVLLAFLTGSVSGLVVHKLYIKVFRTAEDTDASRLIDLQERWGKLNKSE